MNKKNYYVFDFDETIATLIVDWEGLRNKIQNSYSKVLTVNKGLKKAYSELKSHTIDFYKKVEEYELPNGSPQYKFNNKLRIFLKQNNYSIISNNLRKTIETVLKKENVFHTCDSIVSLEECEEIKPSKKPFEHLLEKMNKLQTKNIIYVGDSDIDRQFAENNNIQFIHINDFEAENENTTS